MNICACVLVALVISLGLEPSITCITALDDVPFTLNFAPGTALCVG